MKIEIKNRFTGLVIFSLETDSFRAALEAAVKSRANLYGANLSGANLYGANLYGAKLSGAKLSGAKNAALVIAQTRILPEGSLVGWKKAREGKIVQLHIPSTAKRSHAFGRKCRAECAEVLAIFNEDGAACDIAHSQYDAKFEYRVGALIVPITKFDEDWQEECSSGIHFFITREEAAAYV